MPFTVLASSKVDKYLQKLRDPALYVRLRTAMLKLEEEAFPSNSTKIIGTPGTFRIRVGDYRIIYQVSHNVILILDIGHRRNIYR